MTKIRLASLVLGVTLVIAVIAFTQIFVSPSNAENTNRSLQGMGDLHLVEEQQNIIPLTGVQKSSRSTAGMGDLHLYDSRQVKKSTGSSDRYAGMGDLHLFESLR